MASLNKVILLGNLTRDPELRYAPNGTAVARFGLAVNTQRAGQGEDRKEEVCFVDIVAFGRQAETALMTACGSSDAITRRFRVAR